MRIGVPKETKTLEGRVALVPAAAGDLVKRGHEVWLEQGAGLKSGFQDEQYTQLGVRIAPDAAALYEQGELIVKVKEPIAGDLQHLRRDHLLFCYLHLAAEPALTKRLLEIGLTSVAFETVELPNGELPLLAPMSIIAGKIAVQVGTTLLHLPQSGKGKLLGGEVQVAEQQVVAAQVLQVAGDRFLDLDDHLALLVQRRRVGRDAHAELRVLLVLETGLQARALLEPHLVAALDQVAGGSRYQCDATLEGLGFLGYADAHFHCLAERKMPAGRPEAMRLYRP